MPDLSNNRMDIQVQGPTDHEMNTEMQGHSGSQPPPAPPATRTAAILRLEGAVAMVAGGLAFHALAGSWLWFFLLFLAPDLSMLGYLRGPGIGARVYNLAHTYLFPAALAGLWWLGRDVWILQASALWTAHIGFDRLLGFGLKDPSGFKHTHLQRV